MAAPALGTAPTTVFETLRARHAVEARRRLPEWFARTRWRRAEIDAWRERRLRRAIGAAKRRSPWHAERLAGIDARTVTEADLPRIPAMTKADLMANWDRIVTDRRLSLAMAEETLALGTDTYLLEEFRVVASGGSSGTRGVVVFDWEGWATCFLSFREPALTSFALPGSEALVLAERPAHLSASLTRTFVATSLRSGVANQFLPITLPLHEIVAGLNEAQPVKLSTYPSALNLLAREAEAGRLRIGPRAVFTTGEPLLAEIRARAARCWSAPVINFYGASEGGELAWGCGQGAGMHLNEDLQIVEPVDRDGNAVPSGTRASRVYLTNLYNDVLPLIRYELPDELTLRDEACPCGSTFRRIDDVEGRLDDTFTYGDVALHPHVVRSALGEFGDVVEYQVRQTPRGLDIDIVADRGASPGAVEVTVAAALSRVGLQDPEVHVTVVASLQRNEASGKLTRFLPRGR